MKLRKPEAWPKISRSFVIGIDDLTGTHHHYAELAIFKMGNGEPGNRGTEEPGNWGNRETGEPGNWEIGELGNR